MRILSKRMQSAIFQAHTATNRAAGVGGGSGFLAVQLLNDIQTGTINQNFTTVAPVLVTNSSGSFTLQRQCYIDIRCVAWIAVTGGIDFFYPALILDGNQVGQAVSGDGPKGYQTAPIFSAALLAAGAHTVNMTGSVGAAGTTGTIVQARTLVYQLAA